jgi:hypothetical protein
MGFQANLRSTNSNTKKEMVIQTTKPIEGLSKSMFYLFFKKLKEPAGQSPAGDFLFFRHS